MKYIKTYESYWTDQEYTQDIISGLSKYNITPTDVGRIVDQYENEILDYYNSGKNPSSFVDKIVKDMDLDKGGYMSVKTGVAPINQTIKYL